MKVNVKKLQQGGAAPAPAAPAGGQGQAGAEEQLAQMAQQIVQQLGPEAAAMLAQMIVQMIEGASQQPAPEGQPTYQRKGGKLVMIGKRK